MRLHPAIISFGLRNKSKHCKYEGGSFSLFGINFDVEWDSKEETWFLSCPHIIMSSEIISFLEELYKVHPEGFSDELELRWFEISKRERLTFFDNEAKKWIVSNDGKFAIGLDNNFPNGYVRTFESNDLVFVSKNDFQNDAAEASFETQVEEEILDR